MACATCGSGGGCGTKSSGSGGCGSGGCGSGGCNRMNTFDWLTTLEIRDAVPFELVEVSFKNGARKEFFNNPEHTRTSTGDMVLVEVVGGGYDIGRISLSGELVRVQMKRKRADRRGTFQSVIRKANNRDIERLGELREGEGEMLMKARVVSRTLDLDMKIGDVEFQGDGRKATFFYTADGRVDFRELIRHYAKDFKVKVEMRQIGARQESARVGGIGTCGRELCCSTWLTDFKSVSTAAARYQNLAINQAKLSGQCGRLKCCLNYELDSYLDALESFPDKADRLQTKGGAAHLIKTDVFKGVMVYVCNDGPERGKFYTLNIEQVKQIQAMNKKGEQPDSLKGLDVKSMALSQSQEEEFVDYQDVTGAFEMKEESRRRKKKKGQGDRSGTAANAGTTNRPTNRPNDGQTRPPRPPREPGQEHPPREPRENQTPRPPREPRENQTPRPPREPRENQTPLPPREPRDNQAPRPPREPGQERPPREPRDNQTPRPPREPGQERPPHNQRPPRDAQPPRPPRNAQEPLSEADQIGKTIIPREDRNRDRRSRNEHRNEHRNDKTSKDNGPKDV